MKLRVRLAKEGPARFFSHLDLQRTLERSLRRAGLPIAYTQGFSPHPRISFASALATGTSSQGEFIDVELAEAMAPEAFVAQANQFCPTGLALQEARVAPETKDSLMALLDAAEYRLTLSGVAPGALEGAVAAFLAASEVEVTKESRSGARQVNIRPQVHQVEVLGPQQIRAVLQTGPQGNLKPEDLLKGLKAVAPELAEAALAESHRLMLYRREPESGRLLTPWEL